jgi:K+-sensing histidine kinase KdpD
LNKKGYAGSTSLVFIGLTMAIIFGSAWIDGGINNSILLLTYVLVLTAGLIFGWRYGILTGIISILSCLGLVLADSFGLLHQNINIQNTWYVFITHSITICALMVLQYLIFVNQETALQEAQEKILSLSKTNDKLRESETFREMF